MTRAVSARELAEAIRAVAAGFRVVTLADQPRPSRAGRPRRAAAQPVGARAPGPGPAGPRLLQPPHRRCLLPVAQHGPHPRAERAGQAGRTLQAGGGRAGRAPGAGPHRGPDRPGRPRPEPGGRRRPWVPVRSIVATSSRPAPPPWSAGCSPGASGPGAGAPSRPPPRRARGPAGPAAGRAGRRGHPAHRPHPDLAGTGLLGQPAAGLAAAPGAAGVRGRHRADADPHRGRPHPRAGRRRPAGPDRGPHRHPPPARGSPGSWSGPAAAGSTTGRPPWSRAPPARAAGSSAPTRPTAASASASTPTRPGSSPTPPRHRPRRPAPPRALDEDVELVLEPSRAAAAASGCASPPPAATGRRWPRPASTGSTAPP